MKVFNRILKTSALLLALPLITPTALANEWPERTVTMVVPFPAGGPTDLIARVFAQHIGDRLGQTVIVENRGGANGTVGMAAAASADADGYTILYNTSSIALAPNLYHNLRFDPIADFTGVSSTAVIPLVILTHPSVEGKTVADFAEYAQKNPGSLSYSSAGAGNVTHLGAHLFNSALDIDSAHIPYRGSAPALTDLVGGQVDYMANTLNDSLQFIRSGRVNALAVTSKERSTLVPDVPTLAEDAIPDFEIGAWQGIAVPTGTPQAVIARLNETILDALKDENVLKQLENQGAQPLGSSPEDYNQYIKNEVQRFGEIIKEAGVKLD